MEQHNSAGMNTPDHRFHCVFRALLRVQIPIFIRRLRREPDCLAGSTACVVVDGTTELYTKAAAQELVLAGRAREAEEELCAYAAGHAEVFSGRDGTSGWGATDSVEYVMSNGTAIERADGGKLTDGDFLKSLPKKYIRVKFELNKAKLKADGLDAEALAKLGLVRVETMSLKLKAKAA